MKMRGLDAEDRKPDLQSRMRLFAADVFRIEENVPVRVWYLLSLETIWALPIRGQ
jgi:hypothetical protein